jgi:hypothetical protein
MKRVALANFCLVSIWLFGLCVLVPASAGRSAEKSDRVSVSLNAEEIYEKALNVQDVWWAPTESGIHLMSGVTVQNDSPGCGRRDDDSGVFEEISGSMVLSKELDISGPIPRSAQLVFIGKEETENKAELEIEINSHMVMLRPSRLWLPDAKQYQLDLGSDRKGWGWSRWHYLSIPAEYLRAGRNRILIRSRDGQSGWAIMVADYADFHKGCSVVSAFPKASAKSEDGGKTWRQDNLGLNGKISGEYVARIFLKSYRPSGLILSPVMDAAGEDEVTFKTERTLHDLHVKMESLPSETGAPTALSMEVRSGDSPIYDSKRWSEWLSPDRDGRVTNLRGRYLQWRIKLSTTDPGQSPQLTRVTLDGSLAPDGTNFGKVTILQEENFELGQGPQGYTYENYRSTYLKKFRENFKLDAVVAGAHSDWERQQRLLHWAYLVPLKEKRTIFPWDPQNWIEERHLPDGTFVMNKDTHEPRNDMCLFPNVVLMAALQSFGYPARHINLNSEGLSGHEIVEVWSNQFGKWIYLDAQRDFYWYDKKTQIPVSTLEIHKALEEHLQGIEDWRHPFAFTEQAQLNLEELPIAAAELYPPYRAEDELFVVATSSHLRMIPRSDVFSNPTPIPVSQGREVWCWDGYLNWADAKVPPLEQFTRYTNRQADFNWPLNQIRYVAEETSAPGVVSVSLENNVPYLDALLIRLDGGEWRESESHFEWTLHPGRNSLEVEGRNTAGVEGMKSSLILQFQP